MSTIPTRTGKPATLPLTKSKRKDSTAEILLMKHLKELGLTYYREVRFHHLRRWRFDFSVLPRNLYAHAVAIEIEGGSWIAGRHNRGKGFEADIRKYNEAAKLGWTVIRFTPNMIERGESKVFLKELFVGRP